MIKVVRTNTQALVEEWQRVTAYERDRRAAQEEKRELVRVIMRSWREVVDGRRARSVLGSAYDLPNAYMSHLSYQSTPDVTYPTGGRGVRHQSANVVKNMAGGIPAGSQARVFLNHVRLVDADYLRKRHKGNQSHKSAYTDLTRLAEQGWLGQGSSSDSIDLRKELRGGRQRWSGGQALGTSSQRVCERCDIHVGTSGDG